MHTSYSRKASLHPIFLRTCVAPCCYVYQSWFHAKHIILTKDITSSNIPKNVCCTFMLPLVPGMRVAPGCHSMLFRFNRSIISCSLNHISSDLYSDTCHGLVFFLFTISSSVFLVFNQPGYRETSAWCNPFNGATFL